MIQLSPIGGGSTIAITLKPEGRKAVYLGSLCALSYLAVYFALFGDPNIEHVGFRHVEHLLSELA